MEHAENIRDVYSAAGLWLKPGGLFAHTIGFNAHDTSGLWNGHWTYSNFAWRIIRGRCSYLINREPHSAHIAALRDNNFGIICDDTYQKANLFERKQLAREFRFLTDRDLITYTAFILGRKKLEL